MVGNRFEGLRNLLFRVVEGLVFLGNQSSAGLLFDESHGVANNLFEGNTIWTAPGYLWEPIIHDLEPLGEGNLVLHHRQWWSGSQGRVKADIVHQLQAKPFEPRFDDYWYRWHQRPFVDPITLPLRPDQLPKPLPAGIPGDGGIAGDPTIPLEDKAWITTWRMSGPQAPSTFDSLDPTADQLDGWTELPETAVSKGFIDVAKAAGKSKVVVLSATLDVPEEETLSVKLSGKAPFKLWVSGSGLRPAHPGDPSRGWPTPALPGYQQQGRQPLCQRTQCPPWFRGEAPRSAQGDRA